MLALPSGILAIVFGAISTKKVGSRLRKSGLITGIIGVSICVFLYLSMVIIMMVAQND